MRGRFPLATLSGVAIALAALAGSSVQTAGAHEGCSNHSLRGGYGFAVDGQAFQQGQEFAEFADEGRMVFDGAGSLHGSGTESLNGAINSIGFTGVYNVQTDCTGTATVQGGLTATLKFMLVEGGLEVNAIVTDPGVVAAGQIVKQQLSDCTNASLSGVYNFASTGSAFTPQGEADAAVFDRLQFDGRGHTLESAWISINGVPTSGTATGSYSVNPDCTGLDVTQVSPTETNHVPFVLVEHGAEIKFIVANPGLVFAGSADKQPIDAD